MNVRAFGRYITFFLIAFLPWSVVFSVFSGEKIDLDILRFSKEFLVLLIGITYIFDSVKRKIKIQFDALDITVVTFIWTLLFVSFSQSIPLKGIVFGLRYDAWFLWVIILLRRVLVAWDISLMDLLKTFLISGWIMLACSFLIRYVFWEMILTLIWFSDRVSVWDSSWPPPIYHGIAGASVVRFQGMLEWPNQMAFFLLVYTGSYMALFAQKKKYFFMNILVVSFLLLLLIQTYSRSGYGGFILWVMLCVIYSAPHFFKKNSRYKITLKKVWVFAVAALVLVFVFMIQFGNKIAPIFERHGSTSGHIERMYIGWLRFKEYPFGQWLWQSWPASRSIFSVNQDPVSDTDISDLGIKHVVSQLRERNPDFVYNTETYYIPESWYIQQMIEWWIFGSGLFVIIILLILWWLRNNKYLLGATLGILLMNLVLHSFESVHTAFIWSVIVAAIIGPPRGLQLKWKKLEQIITQ